MVASTDYLSHLGGLKGNRAVLVHLQLGGWVIKLSFVVVEAQTSNKDECMSESHNADYIHSLLCNFKKVAEGKSIQIEIYNLQN